MEDVPDEAHHFFESTAEHEGDYSGGEKRLCMSLRTLNRTAHIYLFDEPLENLDIGMREYVINTILKLSQTKLVLVISHGNDFNQLQDDTIKHIIL